MKFENSEGAGLAKIVDCIASDAAQDEWDRQAARASRETVSRNVARDAMREALRKFIGPYGFSAIRDSDRSSGVLARSPCRDSVWDELLKAGALDAILSVALRGADYTLSMILVV